MIVPTLALLLAGCVTDRDLTSAPKIDYAVVVNHLKYDIATWDWRHKDDVNPVPAAVDDDPVAREANAALVKGGEAHYANPGQVCLGQLSFDIVKVKITLTGTLDRKESANVGLELPIGATTLSPKVSSSRQITNSLTTTVEFNRDADEPKPTVAPVTPDDGFGSETPLADAIDALGKGLVATSSRRPCFVFDEKSTANTIKLGFTVVRVAGGGASFKFVFFTLGADSASTRTAANTIEITLRTIGGFG